MVVHTVGLGVPQMNAQSGRTRQPPGRDPRKHPDRRGVAAVQGDRRAGLDGREQFDGFPEGREAVGQRSHRLRRAAVTVFETRHDMGEVHAVQINPKVRP